MIEDKITDLNIVLGVLNTHSQLLIDCDIRDIRSEIENKIIELRVEKQFKIPFHRCTNVHDIVPYFMKFIYGQSSISIPDNNKSPMQDEWLYVISFSSGAYIFGKHYPKELFDKFFEELKTFNPKYSNTKNHMLYFSYDNAYKIHEEYPKILQKYYDIANEQIKKLKRQKLERELELLSE